MITSVDLIEDGWALTQSGALTTSRLIKLAEARGFRIKLNDLESLCRQALLVPLLAVHDEPQGAAVAISPGPDRFSHGRDGIDHAAREGRLTDPGVAGLPDGWRFDERGLTDQHAWWNGLVYCRWQVLQLANLTSSFTMAGHPNLRDGQWSVLPDWELPEADKYRVLTLMLSAIEARYLPVVDEGWVRLRGADHESWQAYRERFDPTATAGRLGVTGAEVVGHAEHLLSRAKWLDPLGPWNRVVRHAKPMHQEKLKGLALLSLDFRVGAEMLLLFAADLGEPMPMGDRTFWAPTDDRLSRHGELLDLALQNVGVSPHTRVALIVEGETEVLMARKILEHFGYGSNPDGLQIIPMRGVTDQERITKLAAHLATPIITNAYPDRYNTLRPLCRVIVATDPDRPMDDPKAFRAKLVAEIRKGISDQGIDDVGQESIDWLVVVHTWNEPFEFEHFTDQEIADAMLRLDSHPLPSGSTPDSARDFVAAARIERRSLKKRAPRLSKPDLAQELWPLLRDKIEKAIRDDTEVPPLAGVVYEAHRMTMEAMDRHWVLSRSEGAAAPEA